MVLDVLVLFFAVIIILASFQNNQKRAAKKFLKWLIAFGGTLTVFAFNLFDVPKLLFKYAEEANSIMNRLPAMLKTGDTALFYVLMMMFLVSFVLYVLFSIIQFLFSKERKRMKDKMYAPRHKWFWGFIVGILRAALTTYVIILLFKATVPFTSLDLTASQIITLVDKYDPFFPKLANVIGDIVIPWIA